MVKVAVVGSGKLGQRHLDHWIHMPGVEIVGVIARNRERLQKVADKYSTIAFSSIQDLLNQTEVDVFDICTPTYTHPELIIEAAEAKKNIICEKPLALTSVDAQKVIDVCKKNEVQLYVGHTLRFFPAYENAKQQVKKGAIGKPGVIRLKRGVPHPPKENSWYSDDSKSGGLFLDLGIHDIDWLRWTFGDVERVMAKHIKKGSDKEGQIEFGFVTIKMTDGTICYLELSWAETQFQSSFELAGNKGMITFDHDESTPVNIDIRKQEDQSIGVEVPRSVMNKDPYYRQLHHFIQCILGKEEPVVTAMEAKTAISIAEAAIKSAKEGQPVTLLKGGK